MSSIMATSIGPVRIERGRLLRDAPCRASAEQRKEQVGIDVGAGFDGPCRLVDHKRVEHQLIQGEPGIGICIEEGFEPRLRVLRIDLAGVRSRAVEVTAASSAARKPDLML